MVDETLKAILRDYMELRMSEISEDMYCAGWMSGLEETLWNVCNSPSDGFLPTGTWSCRTIYLERLRKASELLGEWPAWNYDSDDLDAPDLKWIPLEEWKRLHPLPTEEPAQ